MGIGRFVEYKETRPLSFSREVRVNNTPMMIRANSILGMVSIISFMSQILCFSSEKGVAFLCSGVYFLCFRCLLRRNATPILTIMLLIIRKTLAL